MTAVQAIKLLLDNGNNLTAVMCLHGIARLHPEYADFEKVMLREEITEEQRQAVKAVAEKGNYLESFEALQ